MSAKITIDPQKCTGCQTCVQLDPDTFKNNPKTFKAEVKNPAVTVKNKEVVDSCPVNAISIKN